LLVRRLDGDFVFRQEHGSCRSARHGLVTALDAPGIGRGTPLSAGTHANDLWCADYKDEFKLGDGRYCYPLTVSDHASRFLLLCEALGQLAKTRQSALRNSSLPSVACHRQSAPDNGVLSPVPMPVQPVKLSVWWLRLGISIEPSSPAIHNRMAATNRMHSTLKKSHPAAGHELPSAAGPFRRLRSTIQCRKTPRALAMMCPRALFASHGLTEASPSSLTRCPIEMSRHRLWPHLHASQEGQHLDVLAGQRLA